jgi:hypothetical protein
MKEVIRPMHPRMHILLGAVLILNAAASTIRSEDLETKGSGSRSLFPAQFQPSVLGKAGQTSETESISKFPSKGRAFLYSLFVPGAGEYYAGSKKMARVFFTSELLLWTTYFSFRTYGHWKEDDYRRFAVSHAGVNLAGKDHQYFVNIENYDSIQDYNEAKLRQRNIDAMYPENDMYSWQWDSGDSRKRFEQLRIASDTAFNNSLFVIGGIVLNHIISGIDALSAARRRAENRQNHIRFGVIGLPQGGGMVTLLKVF